MRGEAPPSPKGETEQRSPQDQLVSELHRIIPDDEFLRMNDEIGFSAVMKRLSAPDGTEVEVEGIPRLDLKTLETHNNTWKIRINPGRFMVNTAGEAAGPVALQTFSIKKGVITAAGEDIPLPDAGVEHLTEQLRGSTIEATWWRRSPKLPKIVIGGMPLTEYKRQQQL